jgi:aspartate kinase
MSKISVLKFGGTSVKNIGRINHVVDVVSKQNNKCLVVVSAMGDTTDHLYELAKRFSTSPNKREVDLLLSTGEQVSIALLAIALQERGIKAKAFTGAQIGIKTDNIHSCARIVDICKSTIRAALEDNDVIVIAGFQGQTDCGEITTLGRGGSDTSAVALAAAAGADECHIYTDVDGIFTTDPNKFPQAKLLDTISYAETIELARAGAQVLHPRAAELARDFSIRLRVRNTFKPDNPGTLITGGKNVERACKVKGVALDAHQAFVSFIDIPWQYSFLTECETLFLRDNIVVDCASQSKGSTENSRCVQLSLRYSDETIFKTIVDELKEQCGAKDAVVDLRVTRISLVGAGIGSVPEIRARALAALTREKIEVRLYSSSDSTISILVDESEASRATQLLHDEFITFADESEFRCFSSGTTERTEALTARQLVSASNAMRTGVS